MADFRKLLNDCLENKSSAHFQAYVNRMLSDYEMKKWVKNKIEILSKNNNTIDKQYINNELYYFLKTYKKRKNPASFNRFVKKFDKYLSGKDLTLYVENTEKFRPYEAQKYDDSTAIEGDFIRNNEDSPEEYAEKQEALNYINELRRLGLKENSHEFKCMLKLYNFADECDINNIKELAGLLECNNKRRIDMQKLLMKYYDKSVIVKKIIESILKISCYARFIKYLMEPQNKKLKIPELITDFNKIRKYLWSVFNKKEISNRIDFVRKSDLKSLSSYEKENRRILALFNKNNVRELKAELNEYSPIKLAKIYETHNVPNLVYNFLLLDLLHKCNASEIKTGDMIKVLTHGEKFGENLAAEDIKNFKKYTLRPRLEELEKYGFIIVNKRKYTLNIKNLTEEQKNILKKVVPIFCGLYPFSSIGHFLANRLDGEDISKNCDCNICNILDDCIAYDLLTAINNGDTLCLKLKNKKTIKFEPTKLYINKPDSLTKVKDKNGFELYLHDIDSIKNGPKNQNPVFSEIYSYYYKIYEETAKEYKKNRNADINSIINPIVNKYGSADTCLFFDKKIMAMISNLANIAIPLTTLERRWLKTIMQDTRFDSFVTEDEKLCLKDLVDDIDAFNLISFKF